MYVTLLKCPVCGAIMDQIQHDTAEPNAIGLSMLGGDGRRLHGKDSPDCRLAEEWIRGWDVETKEEANPTSVCGIQETIKEDHAKT